MISTWSASENVAQCHKRWCVLYKVAVQLVPENEPKPQALISSPIQRRESTVHADSDSNRLGCQTRVDLRDWFKLWNQTCWLPCIQLQTFWSAVSWLRKPIRIWFLFQGCLRPPLRSSHWRHGLYLPPSTTYLFLVLGYHLVDPVAAILYIIKLLSAPFAALPVLYSLQSLDLAGWPSNRGQQTSGIHWYIKEQLSRWDKVSLTMLPSFRAHRGLDFEDHEYQKGGIVM